MLPQKLYKRLVTFFTLPDALLVGGFAAVILLGAIILTLPCSGQVSFLDALFTSTSAVCVTGLVVVDTSTAYTTFGQVVILLLIQAGGLGIMTFAALFFQLLGKRLSLKSQMVLQGSFLQQDAGVHFKQMFKQILLITALTELIGMALLFIALQLRAQPPGAALFSAFFHSVSAFCNAGFSLYSDNLVSIRGSAIFMITIMALIVLGGLGHIVVREIWQRGKNRLLAPEANPGYRPLSVQAKVVLSVTAFLIIGGTVGLLGFGLTPGEVSWEDKLNGALFQSVTARTAGFNSVDIGRLPLASLLLIIILMFIGGSPASCAGGIKTTAMAIFLADLRAKMRGEAEIRLFHRRVPHETAHRVHLLIRLAILWNLVGVFLLLVTENRPAVGFHDILFEQISAFGTVGLSTGLTDKLTPLGKLWIIATMFIGRLGPLTLAFWILPQKTSAIQYPEGRILIG